MIIQIIVQHSASASSTYLSVGAAVRLEVPPPFWLDEKALGETAKSYSEFNIHCQSFIPSKKKLHIKTPYLYINAVQLPIGKPSNYRLIALYGRCLMRKDRCVDSSVDGP